MAYPVVSGRQMLEWLDGRNNAFFNSFSWDGSLLTFAISAGAAANGLRAMLPIETSGGILTSLKKDSIGLTFDVVTIKGIKYAMFDALTGNYEIQYIPDTTSPVISTVAVAPDQNSAVITWITDEAATSTGSTTVFLQECFHIRSRIQRSLPLIPLPLQG